MPHPKRIFQCAVVFSLLLTIGACSILLPEKSGKAVVRIKTSDKLNPDHRNRPSPIVLYIFELRSDDSFQNAPFFELYENPKNILGDDLLGQQEIEISPGEKIELDKLKLNLDTQYIGFLAAYRNLDNAIWRAAIGTPAGKSIYVEVSLGMQSISVAAGKKKSKFVE